MTAVVPARTRPRRAGVLLLGVFLAASLFALAAFHAMLATGQVEIDRIERQVSDAQARYERLRVDVAALEAPARIVREAQERLGMVPPSDVTYLTPSEAVSAEVEELAIAEGEPAPTDGGDRAAWATVKPYLTGRP